MPGSLEPIQDRHGDVGHEDVGVQAEDGVDRIAPISDTADDIKILAQFQANLVEDSCVVVGEEYPNLGQLNSLRVPAREQRLPQLKV